eukprot:789715-Rhodomonas_salina.4
MPREGIPAMHCKLQKCGLPTTQFKRFNSRYNTEEGRIAGLEDAGEIGGPWECWTRGDGRLGCSRVYTGLASRPFIRIGQGSELQDGTARDEDLQGCDAGRSWCGQDEPAGSFCARPLHVDPASQHRRYSRPVPNYAIVSTTQASSRDPANPCALDDFIPARVGVLAGAPSTKIVQVDGVYVQFELWDAGREKHQMLTPSYLRDAAAAIVVYDTANAESFRQGVAKWLRELQRLAPECVVAIVGTKSDLVAERKMVKGEGQVLAARQRGGGGWQFASGAAMYGGDADRYGRSVRGNVGEDKPGRCGSLSQAR